MQNHTPKTEAGYEGQIYDMDEWMLFKLQKLIAVSFCSFTPMSTLAGEIWMDQLSTPATRVHISKFTKTVLIFDAILA